MKPAPNTSPPINLRKPLPLWAAIEHLMESNEIPDSSKAGLKSTAIDAVRYALGDGNTRAPRDEAMRTDIRPLIGLLPRAALQSAEAKHHRNPTDHERRAVRFCGVIRGKKTNQAVVTAMGCPARWKPLTSSGNARLCDLAVLSQCCASLGAVDAPAKMPDPTEILQVAEDMIGPSGPKRATEAMATYRSARRRLLAKADDAERESIRRSFAPLRKRLPPGTSHLGAEEKTFEMIEALRDRREKEGRMTAEARADLPDPLEKERLLTAKARADLPDPLEMDSEALLRELFPELAADRDQWAKTAGAQCSDMYRANVLRAVERLAGMAIRAGQGEVLMRLGGIHEILLKRVEVKSHLEGNLRLAKAAGVDPGSSKSEVSLFAYLMDQEAPLSLARSPLLDEEILEALDIEDSRFVTDSLANECKLLWYIVEGVYSGLAAWGGKTARDWSLIESQWKWLKKQLADRKVPAELRKNAKNKLKLLKTVTAPQLQCVPIPLRKREIHGLRQTWLGALEKAERAGHARPGDHPAVREAGATYLAAAVPFSALCIAFDDVMRRKQYEHGRAGHARNFVIDLVLDEETGQPVGVRRIETRWSGDRSDPACLKVRAVNGRMAERDREVSLSLVDPVILFDVLKHHRAQQLVIAGVLEDDSQFDLRADLEAGLYALFVSGRSGTDELSMSSLGSLVGRELHYIVRKWLRPELPAWEELGVGWRCLWSMHILRLLIASYWGGVRGDWALAEFLTMDVEASLRANYVEVDRGLAERKKLKPDDWEHPNAYDAWMDRLRGREVFDPLLDPDLPLPPHLVGEVERIRAAAANGKQISRPRRSSARIRKARPGQKPPCAAGTEGKL